MGGACHQYGHRSGHPARAAISPFLHLLIPVLSRRSRRRSAMAWVTRQPQPSNVGEPQSVRDAYDKHLAERADWDEFRDGHKEVEQQAEAE